MGSSTPSTQNVVQSTQIPQYQQDYAIENENVARDIGARPYPTYGGQRIAGFSDLQQAGIGLTSANAQSPWYSSIAGDAASNAQRLLHTTYGGPGATYTPSSPAANALSFQASNGLAQWNPFSGSAGAGSYLGAFGGVAPGSVAPWMSPYIEQALKPQLDEISRNSAINAKGINAGATAAGAFGDASHGVQLAENDRNTAKLLSDTTAQGYQSAYDRAVQASQSSFGLNAGQFNTEDAARRAAIAENAGFNQQNNQGFLSAYGVNAGQFNTEDAARRAAIAENAQINSGNNAQALATWAANSGQFNTDTARQLSAAGQLPGVIAGAYGITEQQAKDLMDTGKTQQDQQQAGLSTAYQDFINQFQYPQEMLNLRLATQAGSPYNTTRLTQTPYSPTAQNIGALASLFGLVGRPAGTTA